MSESLTTQTRKVHVYPLHTKSTKSILKKIYCSNAKYGQKHLEIQDLSIVQKYEKMTNYKKYGSVPFKVSASILIECL